ncbi:hypothetical protein [Paraburkholderia sediminicola]|uniref:hypothetical protein n=1 Tax=Paraburkholderia sediminicola TaxID=458836 RepID=UPI0038B9356C
MAYVPPPAYSLAWFGLLAPLVQAAMVIITGSVAVVGLSAWRKQMVAKRHAELAEQVLASFYEARDVFKWVRLPGSFGGEGETRHIDENEDEEIRKRRNAYFIPVERLTREKELFAKLYAQRYTFMAYFGEPAAEPFDILHKVQMEIRSAVGVLMETAKFDGAVSVNGDLTATIGWGRGGRPDAIDRRIDEAVEAIETICKPLLKGQR